MSKTILCIEDNRDSLDLFYRMLSRHGYEVLRAINGTEGLVHLQSSDIDLVLLDINLPGKNGFEILHDLKQTVHHHVPIVAITANSINASRKICIDAGFDGYINKPVIRQELISIVQQFLPE